MDVVGVLALEALGVGFALVAAWDRGRAFCAD